MWDLSSLTRDRTQFPCIARQILNHWEDLQASATASIWESLLNEWRCPAGTSASHQELYGEAGGEAIIGASLADSVPSVGMG